MKFIEKSQKSVESSFEILVPKRAWSSFSELFWQGQWRKSLEIKRPLFFLSAALIIILYTGPAISWAAKAQFSIVYTNDVMGEVEPCG
jgi:hypothetical protein